MLIPRELDPVAAGRDMPLPPERPSGFGVGLTTMVDPTAVDPPAEATPSAANSAAAVTPAAPLHPGGRARRKK